MSRTRHHKGCRHRHCGVDWGAKYRCDKGYSGGTGTYPKNLANRERRNDSKIIIRSEIDQLY